LVVIEVRNKEDYNKKLNPGILRNSFNIYVRVSTKDQIDNTSLDNQRDIGIKYYSTHQRGNYKYVVIWREEGKSGDDVVSEDSVGDIITRELLSTIINHWEDGNIKNLWVYDLSRLSRNTYTSWI
jgi:DNA invertase Pin-like site-specific DNA recombinase